MRTTFLFNILQVLILSIFISGTCFSQNQRPKDHEVYSKVLTEFVKKYSKRRRTKSLVISRRIRKRNLELYGLDTTKDTIQYLLNIDMALANFKEGAAFPDLTFIKLIRKFEDDNMRPIEFEKIKMPYKISILGTTQLNAIFDNGGWATFRKKYRKSFGIVVLSNLTYTKDYKYAIMSIGVSQGGLAGWGSLLLIDVQAKKCIKKVIKLWVS
ncbi:hypothetical protein BKI52_30805 [marine bacterium AO1-C]|nr:hypothetical protein BKI52_30805 [marine bacterium AO1-C]